MKENVLLLPFNIAAMTHHENALLGCGFKTSLGLSVFISEPFALSIFMLLED